MTVELVEVVQRDLARTEELDGTIGHGDSSALVLAATGTLTALPAAGTVLSQGATVVEVDGAPVIAIEAPFPFWRTLGPGRRGRQGRPAARVRAGGAGLRRRSTT